jgi:hypothetical protein
MNHPVKRRSQREWEKIIRAQEESGMSASSYCQQESIGLASFYQWRRRLSKAVAGTESNELPETFISMGHIGGNSEESADRDWVEITLDLGQGLRITLKRR